MKGSRKEMAAVLEEARRLGCTIDRTRTGHARIRTPAGGIVFAAHTASDWHSCANVRAELRRVGVEIPPRGRERRERAR